MNRLMTIKSYKGFRGIVSISGALEFAVGSGREVTKTNAANTFTKIATTSSTPRNGGGPVRTFNLAFRRRRENNSTTSFINPEEDAPLQQETSEKGKKTRTNVTKSNTFDTRTKTDTNTLTAGLTIRLLKTRTIKNMTINGKYPRFSILLAAGNGLGGLGVAHAKAVSASDAIAKATRAAIKNMQYYERWQNRTIFHDDRVKFKATILYLRPAAPESGRRCHPTIAEMCRCMGIKDIGGAIHGSRNPLNVAQTFLKALSRQKTPEQVAQESGMRIVDVLKTYQHGCEELTRTLRSERYSNLHLKNAHRQQHNNTTSV